ncbi:hypothetical protein TCA2_2816 [Paenibacillus sp. TCA20]|nr:hypothetical protein TCA2_2816 [Paenibacillus sp. TCA20]
MDGAVLLGNAGHSSDDAVAAEVLTEDEGHSDLADGAGVDVVPAGPVACSVIPATVPEESARLARIDSLPQGRADPDSFASISDRAPPMQPYISSAD